MDTQSDGVVYDWKFGLNPTSFNGFDVTCRGDINQALWFYGQIRNRGVFRTGGGYPNNRLLVDISDMTINNSRVDNGQPDQVAIDNLILRIGAIKA